MNSLRYFSWLIMAMFVLIIFGCKGESSGAPSRDTGTHFDTDNPAYQFPFELPELTLADELVGQWGDDNNGYIFRKNGTYTETETSTAGAPTANASTVTDQYVGVWTAENGTLTLYYHEDDMAIIASTTYAIHNGVLFLFDNLLVRISGEANGPNGVFSRTISREEWTETDDGYNIDGHSSTWTVTLDGVGYLSDAGWQEWTIVDGDRAIIDEDSATSTAAFSISDGQVYYEVDGDEDAYLMGAMMDNNIILILEEGEAWDTWGFRKQD